MTQSRPEPKVIVIPAKEESPQDQEKKKNNDERKQNGRKILGRLLCRSLEAIE